jgi:hypothetical protein
MLKRRKGFLTKFQTAVVLCIFLLVNVFFTLPLLAAPELKVTPISKVIVPNWKNISLVSDLTPVVEGPTKVAAGDSISLKVIVKNEGFGTAPGTAEVDYHNAYMVDLVLSSNFDIPVKWAVQPVYAGKTKDDFVDDMLMLGGRISNTQSIAPKSQSIYTLTTYIPKKTSPGIYYLGAVADPGKVVTESNENNNIFRLKIEILPPEPMVVKPPVGTPTWIMPYGVGGTTLNKIKPTGLTDYTDWMSGQTMFNAPFAGSLGFRHGYSNNILTKGIKYYRWLYKHESDTEWTEFTESVGVHYVKELPSGLPSFPVYMLGPKVINGMNLFEFRPANPPGVGTYWPTTDIFGDIYSGFLNSEALKDGKYKIKLEIYNPVGVKIMPGATTFKFVVPNMIDASDTLWTRPSIPAEIEAGGFVFKIHIDNRPCSANIDSPSIGTSSIADACGFLRYDPAGTQPVHIAFQAKHSANFAVFGFSMVRGTDGLPIASASGEITAGTAGNYTGNGSGTFSGDFPRANLLNCSPPCTEGAFAENLYVYAKATSGWGHRINKLDAWDVRAFALAPQH